MSFENILKNDVKTDLSKNEYKHNFKERVHVSKSKIDNYSDAFYLKAGESKTINYKDETETRYVAATDLTYDTLISIFDVNSRTVIVYRVFRYGDMVKKDIDKFVKSLKRNRPNLEARIIGMQNNEENFYTILNELTDFFIKNSIKLVEVDLFGTNIRHIAIDAKLGASYNILMEDRIYRAGELVNNMTIENFENALSNERTAKNES